MTIFKIGKSKFGVKVNSTYLCVCDQSVTSVRKNVVYFVKVVRVQGRHAITTVHILGVRITAVDQQPDALYIRVSICEPLDRRMKSFVDALSASLLMDKDFTDPVYDASKLEAHFPGETAASSWFLFGVILVPR